MSGMLQCGQSSSQAEGSDHTGKEKSERGLEKKEFNFWTDQEVWLLLDAYEEKWNQLDRANVKSKHWEEISNRLAGQNTGTWAAKTPTQCKNKIEDMKKKYRAEKSMKHAPGSMSKWAFFARMEAMLRNGTTGGFKPVGMPGGMDNGEHTHHQQNTNTNTVMELDSYSQLENLQFSRQCARQQQQQHIPEHDEEDTSFSTPHNQGRRDNLGAGFASLLERARDDATGGATQGMENNRQGLKRRRNSNGGSLGEVLQVIKSFGESLVRIEEAQTQMQLEVARIHADTERRRQELEHKRAEMMFNTQLQIAKLFSRKKKPPRTQNGASNDEEANGSRSNI